MGLKVYQPPILKLFEVDFDSFINLMGFLEISLREF